jgi:hypothetical protein
VEVPSACLTQAVAFPGAAGSATLEVSVSVDVFADVPLLRQDGAETTLVVDEVRITPTSGAPDLSGITSVVVSAVSPTGSPVEVVRLDQGAGGPAANALVLTGQQVDVAPALENGTLPLRVVLSGSPPPSAWTGDVRACLHGTTKVPYGP